MSVDLRLTLRLTNLNQFQRILVTLGPALKRLAPEDRRAVVAALVTVARIEVSRR